MASASVFERVVSALFGRTEEKDHSEQMLRADMIEMIVDIVEPRVRLRAGYAKKLERCVERTIAFLREAGKTPLVCVQLARANWNDDPGLNAFFARPDDMPVFLGRSKDLRTFLNDPANVDVEEAFALLWMKKEEKSMLVPSLENDLLNQEVRRTAINFSDHRLVAPSASEQQARKEVGRRIIRRLAQVALERIIALDELAVDLQRQKGYLGSRLRMLHLARDGMAGIVDDPATIDEKIRNAERSLKETVDDYVEAKSALVTLDGYIDQIANVFSQPEAHVELSQSDIRIDRLGLKVGMDAGTGHEALTLTELAIGDNLRGVIALARCPRSEMPPVEDLIANAERYL
jgi:hypothetical protein